MTTFLEMIANATNEKTKILEILDQKLSDLQNFYKTSEMKTFFEEKGFFGTPYCNKNLLMVGIFFYNLKTRQSIDCCVFYANFDIETLQEIIAKKWGKYLINDTQK